MSKHKVRYRIIELETEGECDTHWGPDNEPEYAAMKCAEHFESAQYDPKTTWPMTFVLLNEDGSEFGRYTVETEMTPSFSATKIDKPEGSPQ